MIPTAFSRRVRGGLAITAIAAASAAPVAAQVLEPLDGDADGRLDADELRAAFAARGVAAGLDMDADGLLDPVELAEALYALWDTDEDGTLSVGEWDDGVDQWFGEDPVNLAVEVWDRDDDGSVSKVELAVALEETELFAGFDADGDGGLGGDELPGLIPGLGEDGSVPIADEDGLLEDAVELFLEDDGGPVAEEVDVEPLEDEPPLIERGEPFVQLPIPCDGACEETAARFCEALGYEPPLGTLTVEDRLYVIRCADEA